MRVPFSFPRIGRTYRHVVRLRHILDVLVTEGFGFVVVRMNLHSLIRLPKRLQRYLTAAPTPLTFPEQLRRVIEELGPTFIKLGQMLASRPDLLPPAFIRELSQLQDHVAPVPFEHIRPILERELGRPADEVFARFDSEPLAAASLAQIYAAELATGERVVVKVLRPGVRELVRTDLEILGQFAGTLADVFPEISYLRPRDLLDEFALAVKRELDLSTEASNTERLRGNLASFEGVRLPLVFWEYTTDQLLVLERLDGLRGDDVAGVTRAGLDRTLLASRIVGCFMKQVFEDGFYHGDPHPGNILISAAGEVVLIDCGSVGYLTDDSMNALGAILVSFGTGDYDRMATSLLRLGAADDVVDLTRFKGDAAILVGRYYATPLRYLRLGTLLEELSILSRRYGVRLPRELLLLAKTVMLVEGLARGLDDDFNFMGAAEPYARKLVTRRYSPSKLLQGVAGGFDDFSYYLRTLPRELDMFVKRVVRGTLRIELEHRGLERAVNEIDRSSNRLSFALILSAIILSSSLIFVAGVGPEVLGYSILGIGGFIVSGFLGLWLVVAILRSGRM